MKDPRRSPGSPIAATPSLTRNSLAQFVAEGVLYGASLATSVITARWLGPAGKGALSVLLFIAHPVMFWLVSLGVRDSLIVLAGRGRTTAGHALSAVTIPLSGTLAAGAGLLLLISYPADWAGIRGAVGLAALGLAFMVYAETAEAALNAHERLVETNATRGSAALLTAVFTVAFVVLLDGGIPGAVAAVALAQLVRLVAVAVLISRSPYVEYRPTWDPQLVRQLVRLGFPIAASFLLIILSQRIDQIVVYAIAGEAPGGVYAISLTMGQLVGYLAAAVSASSFPRIAKLPAQEGWDLTCRVARMGMVGTVGTALPLAVLIPLVTAPIFGREFAGAVAPALLLLLGGTFWSQQWILSRGAAARGRPRLLLMSFSANVLVMVALDLVLIPELGIFGAALASTVGAFVGVAVCLAWYRRELPGHALRQLVPRLEDVRETSRAIRAISLGRGRR